MGRKKRNIKQEEEQSEGRLKFDIAHEAKRSVVAIILFALAILMFLGFLGKAGVVGKHLSSLAGSLIGWAKWVFPIFLSLSGGVLLFRKKTSFYVYKIIGLAAMFLAVTGLFHWFYDLDKMKAVAKAGSGGGYIGFAVAYLGVKYLGGAGAFVMMISVLLVGSIMTFNISLMELFNKLREKKEQKDSSEEKEEKENEVVESPLAMELEEKEKQVESDPANNIAKMEFVEGKDQYVDNKLLESRGDFEKKNASLSKKPLKQNSVPMSVDENWEFPPLDLLEKSSGEAKGGDVEANAETIEKTLSHFGIEVERGEIKTGPAVTQYSFRPAVGVKISKILSLQNDIALALAAHPIRIEAPIPGKSMIGIEVPNKVSAIVRLRDILESSDFIARSSNLTLALGEDVSGNFVFGNLDKMPHLMIAGATGTGKSVCANTIITSLLYQNSPKDLKMIMVDPKRVELSLYNGIPHLLSDVIVDNSKVVNALKWAVGEMERRYRLLQDTASRDLTSYKEKQKAGKKRKYTDQETGEVIEEEMEELPYIVIIVDELADLMGSHGKEVEGAIVRLAQMARAVGIHLIVSTQRPSVEVITGLIKANITTRIAFQVATQIDSRTILDMAGAEKLLGQGDMLYLSASSPKPKRIQGVFVSESEVKRVVKFIKNQKTEESIGENIVAGGNESLDLANIKPIASGLMDFKDAPAGEQEDDLYETAKEEVIRMGKASASLLQRRLRIGYSRAARILDILEEKGVIGPADGAKPREVYAAKGNGEAQVNYEDTSQDKEKRDKWEM